MHLLLLQVYKLSVPFDLEIKPEYEGCKSWITLEEDLDLIAGDDVLGQRLQDLSLRQPRRASPRA